MLDPLAESSGTAEGYLQALLNCSVISSETYMEQYKLLIDRRR